MSLCVYILQSEKTGRYYIGQTENIALRLTQHNSEENTDYTKRDQSWKVVKTISCACRKQARGIELHIKKMKSSKYIENLLRYPEISEKLQIQYPCI